MSNILCLDEIQSRIKLAETFSKLADIAISELDIRGKAVVVCGPISTGGVGSVAKNLKAIEDVNNYLLKRGYRVFDQVSFEEALWALKDTWLRESPARGYCMPILEEFYLPIYASGLIYRSYFLPNWESSFGARWERNLMLELGIEVVDFSPLLISTFGK